MLSTLAVFGYIAAFMAPALGCLSNEYTAMDGQCCPMCHKATPGLFISQEEKEVHPSGKHTGIIASERDVTTRLLGTVVRRDCTRQSGTRCSICANGTYMNQPNGLNNCFPCTSCDQGHGLFTLQGCTTTTDAICDVLSGYFCKVVTEDKGCSLAQKHTQCAPGQQMKLPGTSRTDTVCERCQPGYFSQDGLNCTVWTICSETQVKVTEGSISSDVVCGPASRLRLFYIPVILIVLSLLALVITGKVCLRKTESSTV